MSQSKPTNRETPRRATHAENGPEKVQPEESVPGGGRVSQRLDADDRAPDSLLDKLQQLGREKDFMEEPELAQAMARLERPAPDQRPTGYDEVSMGAGEETLALDGSQTALLGHELPAEALGRFRFERQIGGGSFGVVYLATDTLLHRRVAVKLPRADVFGYGDLRKRFLRESRAASALNHPNIVPVYEADEVEGRLYIASQYCPGPTLAQWLDGHDETVPPQAAAKLIAELADAVAHAHGVGVLHRDIKPGNILMYPSDAAGSLNDEVAGGEPEADSCQVGSHRSALAAGSRLNQYVPKLCDFGLAKFVDEHGDHTQSGTLLGTVKYMSPEQAGGRVSEISEATDIYALGAILYQLLTGRAPLEGGGGRPVVRRRHPPGVSGPGKRRAGGATQPVAAVPSRAGRKGSPRV